MSEHHPDTESYEISSAPAPHPVTAEIPRQWAQVLGLLRKDLGESTYQNWLCFIGCEGVEGGCAQMTAPSRFKRDWISSHLGDQILKAWGAVNGQVLRLDFLIRETAAAQGSRDADGAVSITALTPATISATARNDIQADMRGGQYGRIGAPLDPRFTFEDFVVGKSNEFAHAAARRVADSDAPPFNPLFLHGGVGLGKTHLIRRFD